MFDHDNVAGFGWDRPRAGRRLPVRRLGKVAAAVMGVTVVLVAALPGLGVLIAAVFWVVLAALVATVAAPAARWAWPHARRLAATAGAGLGPWPATAPLGRWVARGSRWWAVWRLRMRVGRWRRSTGTAGRGQLERAPRALPRGTGTAPAESHLWGRS